jgi:hypothetical protein
MKIEIEHSMKSQTVMLRVCMGHLELNGFEAHPGHVMENGMDKVSSLSLKRFLVDIIT